MREEINMENVPGWKNLNEENKSIAKQFVTTYLNSYGEETRREFKVSKIYICKRFELLTAPDKNGIPTVVGSATLDVTNGIKVEDISLPEEYKNNKEGYTWQVEHCNGKEEFLRVELFRGSKKEWFHVYKNNNNELEFY